MNELLCCNGLRLNRKGLRRIYLCDDVPAESVLQALEAPGTLLKQSKKCTVRRVDGWVLKSVSGVVKHTFHRARYRRHWIAAHHLLRHGVGVAKPIAYIEKGFLGVITANTMVTEYLDGYHNVEAFMTALAQRGAGHDTVAIFLNGLADAVNQLTQSDAYHADLSGKNIFTRDGTSFVFIDLDAVEIGREYTRALRMKNHIQLYDSFCDTLSDTMMVPFIQRMIPPGIDPRVWLPKVRKGQADRRKRLEARRDRHAPAR